MPYLVTGCITPRKSKPGLTELSLDQPFNTRPVRGIRTYSRTSRSWNVSREEQQVTMNDYKTESNVTTMLQTMEWDTLQDRRSKARLSMMYKIQNNLAADIAKDAYRTESTEIRTRSSQQKFFRGFATKNVYKCSYFPGQ